MLRNAILHNSFEVVVLRFIRGEELSSTGLVKRNERGCIVAYSKNDR
jgi:hypothetical protein